MLVRHSMTRIPRSVGPEELCSDVLSMFQQHCIRHAPVLEEGRLVGIVSERDLTRALPFSIGDLDADADAHAPSGPRISRVMAREPLTCGLNDPIDEVAQRMEEARIGCMPVMDQEQLAGIVTVTDLLRGFSSQFQQGDGWPVTLVWTHGESLPRPNIAALSTVHGLRLSRLFESRMEGGSDVFLLRLHGVKDALDAFLRSCSEAHLGVLKSYDDAA